MNFFASFLAQGSLWSGFTGNQDPEPTEWQEYILQSAAVHSLLHTWKHQLSNSIFSEFSV